VFRVWRRREIAAPPFPAKDFEKKPNRLPFLRETVMFQLTTPADPTPAAYQAGLSEQILRDLHRRVAGHVSIRLEAFTIDFIGLCDHALMIDRSASEVQREF